MDDVCNGECVKTNRRQSWGDFFARFKRYSIAVMLIAIFAYTIVTHDQAGIQAMTGIIGAIVGFYYGTNKPVAPPE